MNKVKGSCAYPWASGSDVLHGCTEHSNHLANACSALLDFRTDSPLRVLDVGCGDGRQTERIVVRLSPLAKQLTLVEPDRKLLDRAKMRLTGRFPNLEVLPLADKVETVLTNQIGQYDLILSCHSAYYFKPFEDTVMTIVSSLSDEGLAVFIVRSVDCDSFKVRELFAQHSGESRPRDLSSLIRTSMNACGMRIKNTLANSHLALEHQSAQSTLEFSSERILELLKLWGHAKDARTIGDLPASVRSFCDDRRSHDLINFSLVDEIIVGFR